MHKLRSGCFENTSITMFAMLSLFILSALLTTVWALRWIVDTGKKLPLSREFYIRRWKEPTDPEIQKYLTKAIQNLCLDSIGSLLPHPVVQGKSDELDNKVVLICYDKDDCPVMFNMILKPTVPKGFKDAVFHIGLVVVSDKCKRKGLQKLTILNIVLLMLSYWRIKLYITDIGDSPSAARLISTYLRDVFPNPFEADVKPMKYHVDIFLNMMDKHRADMGVSAIAEPDPKTFVVKRSNDPVGGGSAVLVPFSRDRHSKESSINQCFYQYVDPDNYDELFMVGRVGLPNIFSLIFKRIVKLHL